MRIELMTQMDEDDSLVFDSDVDLIRVEIHEEDGSESVVVLNHKQVKYLRGFLSIFLEELSE